MFIIQQETRNRREGGSLETQMIMT